MRRADWLLVAAFSGVIALVIVALVVALSLSEPPMPVEPRARDTLVVEPPVPVVRFETVAAVQNETVGAWTVEEPLPLYCFPR